MSSHVRRQRRTIPLSDDEKDLLEEETGPLHLLESSLGSSALNSPSSVFGGSILNHPESSISSRGLEPIRHSFLNGNNGSARSALSRESCTSLSTEELRRSLISRKKESRASSSGSKTPSQRTNTFSIGSSSGLGTSRNIVQATSPLPLTRSLSATSADGSERHDRRPRRRKQAPTKSPRASSLTALPDLVSLEQALSSCGAADIRRFIEQEAGRSNSFTKTPVGWKTPFEVDAPRDTPRQTSKKIPSPPASVVSEPLDPHWSEEQDAWKGIDDLLETRSMDDSFCFSTTDILPRATVLAMRSDASVMSRALTTTNDDQSEGGESKSSKRSLRSISKDSAGSSSHSRIKEQSRRSKSSLNDLDSVDESEANDRVTELLSNTVRKNGRPNSSRRPVALTANGGTLFDMFHWSEKDNVDELRRPKTKLNQSLRKVKLVTNSNHGSDTSSLPSLASFRQDELAARSDHWDTDHSKDYGSVVSEESGIEFGFEEKPEEEPAMKIVSDNNGVELEPDFLPQTTESLFEENPFPSETFEATHGIVFDDGVEQYIKKIQQQLPAIVEDDTSFNNSGLFGQADTKEETSPSPTGVTEDNPFDELPSLASLSTFGANHAAIVRLPRQEEKKEPRQTLAVQLMNSIKKMRAKAPRTPKPSAAGNEEKYFPDDATKKFGANGCLLSETDWD